MRPCAFAHHQGANLPNLAQRKGARCCRAGYSKTHPDCAKKSAGFFKCPLRRRSPSNVSRQQGKLPSRRSPSNVQETGEAKLGTYSQGHWRAIDGLSPNVSTIQHWMEVLCRTLKGDRGLVSISHGWRTLTCNRRLFLILRFMCKTISLVLQQTPSFYSRSTDARKHVKVKCDRRLVLISRASCVNKL